MFAVSPVMLLLLVGAVHLCCCQRLTPEPTRRPTAAPLSITDVMTVVEQLKSEIVNMKSNHEKEIIALNERYDGLETHCDSKISMLMQLYDEMRINNDQMNHNYESIKSQYAVDVDLPKMKSNGEPSNEEAKYRINPLWYLMITDNKEIIIHASEINADPPNAEYQGKNSVDTPDNMDRPEPIVHSEVEHVKLRQLLQVSGDNSLDLDRAVGFTAFQAYMSTEYNGGSGDTLLFDDVRVNIGGAYDPATGHFIAPTTGLYVINRSHLADDSCGGANACSSLMVNGVVVSNTCTEWTISTAKTELVQLTAGDDVWVQLAGACYNFFGGSNHQSFSGYLLVETI